MAYTKQTWATGDVITAEKLNHMEDGIASGDALIVRGFSHGENDNLVGTSDRTWQEIHDALSSGARVIVLMVDDAVSGAVQLLVMQAYLMNGKYTALISGAIATPATTNSADGYPTIDGDDLVG